MTTILVTGANGDIADGMIRILREEFPDARLVGADAAGQWPARALVEEVRPLPLATAPDYVEALRALASDVGADLVVPTNEHELRRLAVDVAVAADLPLLVNPAETTLRFLDKLDTARWLRGVGLPAPRTLPLAEAAAADLPLVVKPRRGSGSRAIRIVREPASLADAQADAGADMIAQELLEPAEAEFTCAVVATPLGPRTLAMRRRLLGGLTSWIRVETIPAIDDLLARIAASCDFIALNVQMRLTADGPRVFEINPRFSSTVMMRHRLGFRDFAHACASRLGRAPVSIESPPHGMEVYRRFIEVVVR